MIGISKSSLGIIFSAERDVESRAIRLYRTQTSLHHWKLLLVLNAVHEQSQNQSIIIDNTMKPAALRPHPYTVRECAHNIIRITHDFQIFLFAGQSWLRPCLIASVWCA